MGLLVLRRTRCDRVSCVRAGDLGPSTCRPSLVSFWAVLGCRHRVVTSCALRRSQRRRSWRRTAVTAFGSGARRFEVPLAVICAYVTRRKQHTVFPTRNYCLTKEPLYTIAVATTHSSNRIGSVSLPCPSKHSELWLVKSRNPKLLAGDDRDSGLWTK